MTRSELVEELERLLTETAGTRERLDEIAAALDALKQNLPAPGVEQATAGSPTA